MVENIILLNVYIKIIALLFPSWYHFDNWKNNIK